MIKKEYEFYYNVTVHGEQTASHLLLVKTPSGKELVQALGGYPCHVSAAPSRKPGDPADYEFPKEIAALRKRVLEVAPFGVERWIDENGTLWGRPTAWAYAQVCKARDAWQAKAEGKDVPDETWTKADGTTIAVRNMTEEHAKNALRMCIRAKREPASVPAVDPDAAVSRLIDAWSEAHKKPIPWEKAVEITAIVKKLSDHERQRLLSLNEYIDPPEEDEEPPAVGPTDRHEWVDDGVAIHNGEYYYKCKKCGASDWIPGYGKVTDLPQGPCVPKTTGHDHVAQELEAAHAQNRDSIARGWKPQESPK